jgi:hypothetical protein
VRPVVDESVEERPREASDGPSCRPGRARARYAIRVAGDLSRLEAGDLDSFRVIGRSADGVPTTELVGEVSDQAELLRALRVLHAQQLVVVHLVCLSEAGGGRGAAGGDAPGGG